MTQQTTLQYRKIIPKTRQPAKKKPSGGDQKRRCPKEGMTQQTTLLKEAQHYYKSHKKPSIIIPKTRQPAEKKPSGGDQERRYAHYRKKPRRAQYYDDNLLDCTIQAQRLEEEQMHQQVQVVWIPW